MLFDGMKYFDIREFCHVLSHNYLLRLITYKMLNGDPFRNYVEDKNFFGLLFVYNFCIKSLFLL